MELAIIITIAVLFLAATVTFVFTSFRNPSIWLHVTFLGYKKIEVKDYPSYSGSRSYLTVTKDGKYAPYTPQFPGIKGWDLFENGTAKFQGLGFIHATWKYV